MGKTGTLVWCFGPSGGVWEIGMFFFFRDLENILGVFLDSFSAFLGFNDVQVNLDGWGFGVVFEKCNRV